MKFNRNQFKWRPQLLNPAVLVGRASAKSLGIDTDRWPSEVSVQGETLETFEPQEATMEGIWYACEDESIRIHISR